MATKKIADKKLETEETKVEEEITEKEPEEINEEELEELKKEIEDDDYANSPKDEIVKGKGSVPQEAPVEDEHKTVKSNLQPANSKVTVEMPMEYSTRKNKPRAMKFKKVSKKNSGITFEKNPEQNKISLKKQAQMDMIASKENGMPLTATMTGVVPYVTAKGTSWIITVNYNGYLVKIPSPFFHTLTEEEKIHEHAYLFSRMGGKVSFVIEEFNEDEETAIGNRRVGMENLRRMWWFGKMANTDEYRFREGIIADANVTSVSEKLIFVEIFGVESIIPINELSYNRISDARNMLRAGDTIKVRIKRIERDEKTKNIKMLVSAKAAYENPKIKSFGMYEVGGIYRGQITWIYISDRIKSKQSGEGKKLNGIFVSLDDHMECLCPLKDLPPDINPKTGDYVSVKITRANESLLHLDGKILRVDANYKY